MQRNNKHVRHTPSLLTLLASLLLLAGLCLPAQAEQATMSNNIVYLPLVDDYPDLYSMELRLVPGKTPLEFTVQHVGNPRGDPGRDSPWYDDDVLVVPSVLINGVYYWAELLDLGNDRLRLQAHGRKQDGGRYQHLGWARMAGDAKDIGVGADGTVWAVGTNDYGDDYGLYSWNGRAWSESRGSAVRVDVDARGQPWVINSEDEIFRLRNGRWEQVYGEATDIGIGADGSIWVVSNDDRSGGHSIYTWKSPGWLKISGAGVRIDVEPNGTPWIINDDNEIFRRENGLWRRMPGYAKDIGIGADGSVWVIGSNDRAGGYGIYRFNGASWDRIAGSASQISVAPDGTPWVVNNDGEIYRGVGR